MRFTFYSALTIGDLMASQTIEATRVDEDEYFLNNMNEYELA